VQSRSLRLPGLSRDLLFCYKTTKNYHQIPYNTPMPEDLIRKIAEYCLRAVREREDDAFW
jgi:uncharacterized protein YdhG (YjbR/CyaY superfamily)